MFKGFHAFSLALLALLTSSGMTPGVTSASPAPASCWEQLLDSITLEIC